MVILTLSMTSMENFTFKELKGFFLISRIVFFVKMNFLICIDKLCFVHAELPMRNFTCKRFNLVKSLFFIVLPFLFFVKHISLPVFFLNIQSIMVLNVTVSLVFVFYMIYYFWYSYWYSKIGFFCEKLGEFYKYKLIGKCICFWSI